MKEATSRRLFLQKTALATTGIALLSSGVANAFTKEIPFEGYNPYADTKTDLRTQPFGKHLDITGVIYDKINQPISNATVEVWHLSPNSKKYRHRSKLLTDDTGAYRFVTDFPGKEKNKPSKVFYKISKNNTTYYSELLITRNNAHITSKHWCENKELGQKLLPTIKESGVLNGATKINFNLSIN